MARTVVFLPEVEADIGEAYWWYEEKDLGLGGHFEACEKDLGLGGHFEACEKDLGLGGHFEACEKCGWVLEGTA